MKQRKARRWYGPVAVKFRLLHVGYSSGRKEIVYSERIKPYSAKQAKETKRFLLWMAKLNMNSTYGKLGTIPGIRITE